MKVVAYSIKPFEKGWLAKANNKKHDITLISNALSIHTAFYAEGKDAVIVFTNDDLSEKVINMLAAYGIKYITTRFTGTDQIDKKAAAKKGIQLAHVSAYSFQDIVKNSFMVNDAFITNDTLRHIAAETIGNLDKWQREASRKV